MRDPFDELKSLEGVSRSALPPAEVRRRGDRLRRRRTALQAAGAAAAVAVIASGGLLASGGQTGTEPLPGPAQRTGSPAPSPTAEAAETSWLTGIPEGFPIGRGLPEPGGDVPAWERADGPTTPLAGVACADTEQLPARPVDAVRVQVTPPDESQWRHLLLFEDAATADDAVQGLLRSAHRCSEGPQGVPLDRLGPEEVRWTVGEAASGDTHVVDVEGALYARDTDTRVPGRIISHVVRVGNAVLVDRRDSASSATGMDAEVRAFTRAVEAVTAEMCVFSAAGCDAAADDPPAAASPDDLEPEPLPHVLTAEDLDEHTGETGWTSTQGILEQPMVCAEESTEALAGDRTDTRMYARFDGDGTTVGMATTTVLGFEPGTWAADGYERAADWLATCDRPLDGVHQIFSAGQAYGPVHAGSFSTGRWAWRTVMSTAPEVCQECDAAWNHHQGVALAGDRLVIVQVSTRGDLQQSVDDRGSPLPDLLRVAAALAAGAADTPPSAGTGPATETFGPAGARGLTLGTDITGGAGAALVDVLGGSRCQAFRLRGPGGPANNVDGFAERRRGVVVLLARDGMTTPQGVGLGSSRQDVLEAHPGGEDLVPGYRVAVPGRPGTHYQFGFADGLVDSLMLARDDQSCIG